MEKKDLYALCESGERYYDLSERKNQSYSERDIILDARTTNILMTLGIPTKIKGYRYLREGIKIAVNDINALDMISEKIYAKVAFLYGAPNAKSVERACSYAIELSCNSGKMEKINGILGVNVYKNSHDKPSVGEFTALISDKIRLELMR